MNLMLNVSIIIIFESFMYLYARLLLYKQSYMFISFMK